MQVTPDRQMLLWQRQTIVELLGRGYGPYRVSTEIGCSLGAVRRVIRLLAQGKDPLEDQVGRRAFNSRPLIYDENQRRVFLRMWALTGKGSASILKMLQEDAQSWGLDVASLPSRRVLQQWIGGASITRLSSEGRPLFRISRRPRSAVSG